MGYICTRCGGTKVACEAIVNPNTREIIDYFDGSFVHAICRDCENEVIISNVEEVTLFLRKYRETQSGSP